MYQRFYPLSTVSDFATLMFDYLDEDESGVIDFMEFYQVIIVTETCNSKEVCEIDIIRYNLIISLQFDLIRF